MASITPKSEPIDSQPQAPRHSLTTITNSQSLSTPSAALSAARFSVAAPHPPHPIPSSPYHQPTAPTAFVLSRSSKPSNHPRLDKKSRPNPHVHGHVRGVEVGDSWATRAEASQAGVHAPYQGGISGTFQRGGAESIVLNGGYPDGDCGDIIWYMGCGGFNERATGKKSLIMQQDQEKSNTGNRAMEKSIQTRLPVRVVRGADDTKSPWAPSSGYRYDGLYKVTHSATINDPSGYTRFKCLVWRLERIPSSYVIPIKPGYQSRASEKAFLGRQRKAEEDHPEVQPSKSPGTSILDSEHHHSAPSRPQHSNPNFQSTRTKPQVNSQHGITTIHQPNCYQPTTSRSPALANTISTSNNTQSLQMQDALRQLKFSTLAPKASTGCVINKSSGSPPLIPHHGQEGSSIPSPPATSSFNHPTFESPSPPHLSRPGSYAIAPTGYNSFSVPSKFDMGSPNLDQVPSSPPALSPRAPSSPPALSTRAPSSPPALSPRDFPVVTSTSLSSPPAFERITEHSPASSHNFTAGPYKVEEMEMDQLLSPEPVHEVIPETCEYGLDGVSVAASSWSASHNMECDPVSPAELQPCQDPLQCAYDESTGPKHEMQHLNAGQFNLNHQSDYSMDGNSIHYVKLEDKEDSLYDQLDGYSIDSFPSTQFSWLDGEEINNQLHEVPVEFNQLDQKYYVGGFELIDVDGDELCENCF